MASSAAGAATREMACYLMLEPVVAATAFFGSAIIFVHIAPNRSSGEGARASFNDLYGAQDSCVPSNPVLWWHSVHPSWLSDSGC
jgi:hypothetical protein